MLVLACTTDMTLLPGAETAERSLSKLGSWVKSMLSCASAQPDVIVSDVMYQRRLCLRLFELVYFAITNA